MRPIHRCSSSTAHRAFQTMAAAALAILLAALSGCGETVQVAPSSIEPITITIDINLKIDQDLANFFAYQKPAGANAAAPATDPAATAPADAAPAPAPDHS